MSYPVPLTSLDMSPLCNKMNVLGKTDKGSDVLREGELMRFYKVVAKIICCENYDDPENENSDKPRGYNPQKPLCSRRNDPFREIASVTRDYNRQLSRDAFVTLSHIAGDTLTFAVIVEGAESPLLLVKDYCSRIQAAVGDCYAAETAFEECKELLDWAKRYDYLQDDNQVYEQWGLRCLTRYRVPEFEDRIIGLLRKNVLFQRAEKTLCSPSLMAEFDRIFAQDSPSGMIGHPVHYFIETDDKETLSEVSALLVSALYAKKRVRTQRICCLELKREQRIDAADLKALYRMNEGGAITILIEEVADGDSDRMANYLLERVNQLCEVALKQRNEVLTVFCLPRECSRL